MSKFKIGDKVRVIGSNLDFKRNHIGLEFIINSNEGDFDGEDSWTDYGPGGERKCVFRWKESELELAKETKVTEFKAGDVVRILDNRNCFGERLHWLTDIIGTIVTLEEEIDDINEYNENGDWTAFGVADSDYWVRSDDIELVSLATPEQTEIADLKVSNARLADANEAKRERLNAIKAIVNADDVDGPEGDWAISTEDGSVRISSDGLIRFDASLYIHEESKLPKYSELLGDFETADGSSYTIANYADGYTGYEVDIQINADECCWCADDLEELATHLNNLAKRMRKKQAKANR